MPEPEGEQPIFEDLNFPADDLTFAEKEGEAAPPSEPAAASPAPEGHDEAIEPVMGEELAFSAAESPGEEPVVAEEAPAEDAAEAEADAEPEETEPEKKKAKALPAFFDWIVVAAVCVAIVLLLLVLRVPSAIWHGAYLIAMIAMAFYLWKSRKTWAKYEVTALYTVVLAGAAAAMLTGVYCLGLRSPFPTTGTWAPIWESSRPQRRRRKRSSPPPSTRRGNRRRDAPCPRAGAMPTLTWACTPSGTQQHAHASVGMAPGVGMLLARYSGPARTTPTAWPAIVQLTSNAGPPEAAAGAPWTIGKRQSAAGRS